MKLDTDIEIKNAFFNAKTRSDIAALLDISEKSLRFFLYSSKDMSRHYTPFFISKRNGGKREINAPCKELKSVQKKLAKILSIIYEPKTCVHGFCPQRSIITNAKAHVRHATILNVDLKDFFSQIHFGRVMGLFISPPYSLGSDAAKVIAQLCCVKRVLPQGAPTSPIITNMVCSSLDSKLIQLCKADHISYSRYADDLTFSIYHKSFPKGWISYENSQYIVGDKLRSVIESCGFTINQDKISLRTKYQRQEVTGIITNKHINVKREYKRNLRAILHHCETQGVYATACEYINKGYCHNHLISSLINKPSSDVTSKNEVIIWFLHVIKSKILFMKQVCGDQSGYVFDLSNKFNALQFDPDVQALPTRVSQINLINPDEERINANVVVLEDKNNDSQGSGFFIKNIGLITNYHVVESATPYQVHAYQSYPESKGFVMLGMNGSQFDKTLDYAIFNISPIYPEIEPFAIANSRNLRIGDTVTLIGYPNFSKKNTYHLETCKITSIKTLFGAPFYTVSGRIIHGASGGIVLNSHNRIVGVIRAGTKNESLADSTENHGFIPIHAIQEHYHKYSQAE